MSAVEVNQPAPDFTIDDYQGNPFHLKEYEGKKNVLLVFNRGFT